MYLTVYMNRFCAVIDRCAERIAIIIIIIINIGWWAHT